MSCLYILEINYLSVASFATIFSHSESCLFTLVIVSFIAQKLLSLIRSICPWLLSKSLQAINAEVGVEKREPSYTVGGNAN